MWTDLRDRTRQQHDFIANATYQETTVHISICCVLSVVWMVTVRQERLHLLGRGESYAPSSKKKEITSLMFLFQRWSAAFLTAVL